MPYVPSKKTDGKSTDREIIDAAVEKIAEVVAKRVTNNFSLIREYSDVFWWVSRFLRSWAKEDGFAHDGAVCGKDLAQAIWDVGAKYGYEGAFLGELNYAITRLIQRVPQLMVKSGKWKDELRYWVYAATVEALTLTAVENLKWGLGIGGVFEDIKDEYKRRVNTAYEAAQIVKSGDCYDTPYYTRLVEVVDEKGKHVGYQEVMLKRSDETLNKDVLDGQFILRKKKTEPPDML